MGQAHALLNLFILLAVPVGGLLLGLAVATASINPRGSAKLALILYVLGVALFLIAKISVFRSGHLVTFGTRLMRPGYRVAYRAGYAFMVAGALFAVALLVRGPAASISAPHAESPAPAQSERDSR